MNVHDLPEPLGRQGWPWTHDQPEPTLAGTPRLTIVTPSYNQGMYLEEAIRSVLMQGYPNLEYFILDGGSDDGSVSIIRRYEQWLAGWTSSPDSGPADAINRGFEQSTGDILAWLNADDLYAPGTLYTIAEAANQHPGAGILYGEGWYIDEASNWIEPCRFVRRKFVRRYLINRDPILQPAAFWRRNLWEMTGPLDTSLRWVFDWEWFIRASAHGSFHYLPRILAYYRIQPAALTRTGGLLRQLEHGRVTRRYGAWWYPNHVVQQARRLDETGRRATRNWPRLLSSLVRLPFAAPRVAAEWVLRGMYMQ